MATVFRAIREPDGMVVVVKRVRPSLALDASYLRLFADEAVVHGALNDDHIVRLLDRGEDSQGPFLVFEHVEGTDLGVLLDTATAEGQPLEIDFTLAVGVAVASALTAVHEATRDGESLGIVHRDISPANILLGLDGTVKLADFGVAASRLKTEHTTAGELKGKFAYMAPEQTRGEPTTPRSDLFALGVVLWECLQNRRLWDRATDADVVHAVREELPAPLDAGRVGEDLACLVVDLLQKDPAARPSSAREVRERLRKACLERAMDDGLARIVARAVRLSPRRQERPLPDLRRRTLRVHNTAAHKSPVTRMRALGWGFGGAAALAVLIATGLKLAPLRAGDDGDDGDDGDVLLQATRPSLDPPNNNDTSMSLAVSSFDGAQPPRATPTPGPTTSTTPAKNKTPRPPSPPGNEAPSSALGGRPSAVRPTTASPQPKSEGFGRLSVMSEPWARVSIDGVVVAEETPVVGLTLPAGRHAVRLDNPVVGIHKLVVVDLEAGEQERIFVDLLR